MIKYGFEHFLKVTGFRLVSFQNICTKGVRGCDVIEWKNVSKRNIKVPIDQLCYFEVFNFIE